MPRGRSLAAEAYLASSLRYDGLWCEESMTLPVDVAQVGRCSGGRSTSRGLWLVSHIELGCLDPEGSLTRA
jgi:hypothetical protein